MHITKVLNFFIRNSMLLDHMMKKIRFNCKMGAQPRSERTKVTGGKVYVYAKLDKDMMVIKQCDLTHNHPLHPDLTRLMVNYRCIDEQCFRKMALNDAAGISLNKSFNSFVIESGGHENVSFTHRDLRNTVNLHRHTNILGGDATAVEKHFKEMAEFNTNFYRAIQTDSEGMLVNIFWADARCKAQYKDFGDIITFDTTFLCNK